MTIASTLLNGTTALIAALSQTQTNGNSELGTVHSPHIGPFLTDNPIENGYPWGSKTSWDSEPYSDAPDTGVVRKYTFNVARATIAPDGYEKDQLLINGAYPGPLIEANWGDMIQVTVNNHITGPSEGTTFHWHGFHQQNTEWEDGVPGVSMCPIPPGESFTYTLNATPYGTTWYHSHYSAQYAGGLWGPLVIHGPKNLDYDIDLGPVTVTDYYHRDYFDIMKDVMGTDLTKVRPASDNNLINGKMDFDCANTTSAKCTNNAGLAKFQFTSGKTHRLRLINTGSAAIQKFSIDDHELTVIANDFTPVEPYNTSIITLGIGQRTDVVIHASGKPDGAYWMRSTMSAGQCTEPSNQPYGLAVVYYEKANQTAVPKSTGHIDGTDPCANDALPGISPSKEMGVPTPATTIYMEVNFKINATGHLVWTINNSTFRGDYNNPLLLDAKKGNVSYPFDPQYNVYNVGDSNSVRVIITNKTPTSHPWHLHGHETSVLAVGAGTWDGTIVNPKNPQRRDVNLLPASGYLVLQWNSDNPGVWPFHCHIAWHLSGGLYSNIIENDDGIKKLLIPDKTYENCDKWSAYTKKNTVEQIDSGLRLLRN